MKIEINKYQFSDMFKEMNRESNFSLEARDALFNYFEDLEADLGESVNIDIIAICCDFSEFDSLEDLQNSYPDIESFEQLLDNTQAWELDNGKILIQNY